MTALIARTLGIAALALFPGILPAQVVRGRVLDADAGRPLVGGIITLQTAQGRRLAPTLAREDGSYAVTAPGPGTYHLRVDVIGYEAWRSEPIALSVGDTLTRDVRLPLKRIELAAVQVRGTSVCATKPQASAQAVNIWQEIERALTLAGLGEQRRLPFELRVVERLVRAQATMGTARRSVVRSETVQPWSTPSPARLTEQGWVVWDGDSFTFHGPSINALLSEEFLATHCFTPVRRRVSGQSHVGLAFTPLAERTLPDIAGTIWLDERTSELRTVEFTYEKTTDSLPNGKPPGGALEFARLPSGLWYTRRWTLRLPFEATNPDAPEASTRRRRRADPNRWRFVPYRELVGEAVVLERDGRAGLDAVATVSGKVVDSTSGAPLEGVWVLVPGEPMVRTDSAGRYSVDVHDVPRAETEYLMSFEHPYFDALGLPGTVRPAMLGAGGMVGVDFAVPPLQTLMRTVCPAPEGGSTGDLSAGSPWRVGLATGRLRSDSGAPLPDSVHLQVEWSEDLSLAAQAVAGPTGPEPLVTMRPGGQFLICPLPIGRPVVIEAQHDGRVVASTRFEVPPTGVAQQDLVLGAAGTTPPVPGGAARGDEQSSARDTTAEARRVTLAGVVRDTAGRPLSGAEARSGEAFTVTGPDGAFELEGFTGDTLGLADTIDLLVRRIGYRPASAQLRVQPDVVRVEIAVTLVPTALELGAIVIEGRQLNGHLWRSGFYARQRQGFGTLIGPDDLERRGGTLEALVRSVPGADVDRDRSGRTVALGRRPGGTCPLTVVMDGVQIRWAAEIGLDQLVDRRDILALEVYPRATLVPAALAGSLGAVATGAGLPSPGDGATNAGSGDCGVLVIWTKPFDFRE